MGQNQYISQFKFKILIIPANFEDSDFCPTLCLSSKECLLNWKCSQTELPIKWRLRMSILQAINQIFDSHHFWRRVVFLIYFLKITACNKKKSRDVDRNWLYYNRKRQFVFSRLEISANVQDVKKSTIKEKILQTEDWLLSSFFTSYKSQKENWILVPR